MLLRRHRAAGTWQGEGAHADLCFMLWARDLDWSLIGNDNGAGVAYCHVKHSEWLMTIKVNAEEKRNRNHWFESSRSYIFSQHNDAHVDMHVHSNARIICPIFHCRGFICVSCYLVISKNKKRRRRGWVLTIRRRDQATHTLMSQSCFLMCLCTAGHINTSTADASILNNPKSQEKVSFLGFAMEMMKQGMSEQHTSSPLSPKHLSSSALLCSCSTWLTADLCHPRSLWNCVFTFNSFHN